MKPLENNQHSDHLVLVGKPRLSSADQNFFDRDWSLAWTNFLLQEVGTYTQSSLESFQFEKLNSYRFAYLPSSLSGKLNSRQGAQLESYVQSGGTLILEGPTANSLQCSGIRFSSKNKTFRSITSVHLQMAPPSLVETLLRMSFQTLGWEIESRQSDTEVILEMGTPVFFKRFIGKGKIFTLGFDFGLLLVGLEQGVPVNGSYHLQKLFGTQPRVVEPEDLVLKASLLDNPVPWVDLFERFLFKVITQDSPTPRWWYFPNGHTGAVISTHDDEEIGSDSRLKTMCETEKSEGFRGTLFIISDQKLHERWSRNGSLAQLNQKGPEIGLHWNRFKKPRFKLRSRKFGMHETPLGLQVDHLEKELGQAVRINRTHYLDLGKTYDEHFRLLAAQGISFDSTYGPNQGGKGYLFGTGYPYYGLTWDGQLSGVLELPFLTQETWGGTDLDFLKQLIRESDENFHQCVVTNFHPHYTILQEKGRETWLGSLRFAKERKQWCPAMGEFFQFFKNRSMSPLQSRFKEDVLEVFVDSREEGGTLSLPSQDFGKNPALGVEVDGIGKVPQKITNGWFEEWLVPIPAGSHYIKVHYVR